MITYGAAAWGFRETPLEEQFKITKNLGLKALELGIANAPNDIQLDASDEALEQMKELATKYGIDISCAATGNDFTVGSGDVQKIKTVMDICTKLGVKNLRVFTGFTPISEMNDEKRDNAKTALKEVCTYGEKLGITIAIETHGAVQGFDDGVLHIASSSTDIDYLYSIMEGLPSNAKICYDPANLSAVGEDALAVYHRICDKICYAHYKEFAKLPSGHLKPTYCGAGMIDWKTIKDAMKDFDGYVFFEYENTEDIEAGLERSRDYINEV